MNKGEISHRRELLKSYGFNEILDHIAASYRASPKDILGGKPSEAKKVAIYLVKRLTGMTNRDIGTHFGELSYSAVAKVCRRLEEEIAKNRTLRRTVTMVYQDLSRVNRLLKNSPNDRA